MNGNSSSESFGKYQMQSSSSESKSKIVIEKVNGVVKPNVSPGKKSPDKTETTAAAQPNMITVKKKPGPVTSTQPVNGAGLTNGVKSSAPQPPVNMIQVNNILISDPILISDRWRQHALIG